MERAYIKAYSKAIFDFSFFYLKYTVAFQIKGPQVMLFDTISQIGSCGQ